jgi:hypothetical protein
VIETRPFDYDPFTKIEQVFHYNHDDESITFERIQHGGGSMIEELKDRYNAFDERTPFKGDTVHVASIPAMIAQDMQRSGALDDQSYMRRWLNSWMGRPFRTRPGRV